MAPHTLTPAELQEALESIPSWTLEVNADAASPGKAQMAIHRAMEFPSFDLALQFMRDAAPFINRSNHHPRWENSFKTLGVYLTTHDAGDTVTQLDIDLAQHLDVLYARQP